MKKTNTDKVADIIKGLPEQQLKARQSAEWLYFGARRAGRTYLLAVICIQAAMKEPHPIKIFDHPDNSHGNHALIDMVGDIIVKHKLEGFHLNRTEGLVSHK